MRLHEESVNSILLKTSKCGKNKRKSQAPACSCPLHLTCFHKARKDIWDARLPACKQHKCWLQTLQNLYIIQEVFRGGEWSSAMRKMLQHNWSRKLFHTSDIRTAYFLKKKKKVTQLKLPKNLQFGNQSPQDHRDLNLKSVSVSE